MDGSCIDKTIDLFPLISCCRAAACYALIIPSPCAIHPLFFVHICIAVLVGLGYMIANNKTDDI